MKTLRLLILSSLAIFIAACGQIGGYGKGAPNAHTPSSSPKRVALLLPLTGPLASSGKAIENGFFKAYYQDKAQQVDTPEISVYNTANSDINALYLQAVAKGADLVIGPLLKDQVNALENRGNLPVPVLALNDTASGWSGANNSVFQFALSPQAEAEQVAVKMFRDGYRKALVITPAGNWGNGIANAFDTRFKNIGGSVVDSLSISNNQNLSSDIKNLLHFTGNILKDREKLKKQKASIDLQQEAELEKNERRQDFDVIFLAVSPQLARQIKPMLNYYYTDNVPVYATSLVYAGKPSPSSDRDLDGIVFCDMPWATTGVKNDVAKHKLARFYAFGEDAYSLSKSLGMLAAGSSVSGETGTLYLSSNMQIQRELNWAKFKNGMPVPIA